MTPIPATHVDHDPLAVAAFAAGDAEGAGLDAAMAQVAACAECAALHHDLRAIATALPALPAAVRTRDFRLTPEQAASLRPSGWRRLLAPLAGPRFAFAGPLGTGLATLGIAGFLVAGAVGMPLAGSAAAPQDATTGGTVSNGAQEVTPAASPAPEEKALEAASMAPMMAPVDPEQVRVSGSFEPAPAPPADEAPATEAPAGFNASQAGPGESAAAGATAPAPTANAGTGPALPLLSGLVLAVGIVLVGLRVAGRRLAG
jgi:hypothetical protein